MGSRSNRRWAKSLFREQYLDAVAAIINAQEAAGLDIVTDGDSRFDLAVGGKSWFFYPIERIGGIERPSRYVARLDGAAWPAAGEYPVGGAGGVSAWRREGQADARSAGIHGDMAGGAAPDRPSGEVRRDLCAGPGSMLWNEFYPDDKQMVLDLCDIMNADSARWPTRAAR